MNTPETKLQGGTPVRSSELVRRWRKDADQYQNQVDEARAKNLPHDQMMSYATCLRACAKELENAIAPNVPDQ